MAELPDMAQFARAGWRMALLIPSWVAQIAMLLGLMGIFTYRLAETIEHWDEMRAAGDTPRVELVYVLSRPLCELRLGDELTKCVP
jgi:hypothetical protein